jgi:hypothetical protein
MRFASALLLLGLLATPAVAQPARPEVVAAQLARARSERRVLEDEKRDLSVRYEAELRAIDKLKRQRASWRRDRQLQGALAKSHGTARNLALRTADLAKVDMRLAEGRAALLEAIDDELGSTVAGPRQLELVRMRAPLVLAHKTPRKIVVPSVDIDPLADPEELDQVAQALRDSETTLAAQVTAFDQQVARLQRAAELRKQHERAGEIALRDDDQPRRQVGSEIRRGAAAEDLGELSPPPGDAEGPASGLGDVSEETVYLISDVVDSSTVDALRSAGRGSDPGAKAAAALRARNEVAARLKALRDKRLEVEARAQALRR